VRDSREPSAPGGTAATSVVHPGAGLRVRLWLAFLLDGLAGALAALGLLAWLRPSDPLFNPWASGLWPWTAAAACVVLAIALGLWLDHGIASHLRGLSRAIASGDPTELATLPGASGWGELSLLAAQIQSLLVRQREMGRSVLELEELRHRIRSLRVAVDVREPGQHAEPLRPLEGPLGPLVEALNRHWDIEGDTAARGRDGALELRRDLGFALADSRDSAEQAERGFVEATALLTTVRELQRLGAELHQELAAPAPPAAAAPSPSTAEAQRRWREAAAAAIDELVVTSTQSVEHLAAGLAHVRGIEEQVQVLANRATLIALNVVVAGAPVSGSPGAPRPDDVARDLKGLAREVRDVTEHTAGMTREIDREVAAAAQRMQGLRERVAARLDEAPPVPDDAGAGGPRSALPSDAALRLLGRVREMVQDAAAKGERLSATGERASRAAERTVRRLEEEAEALERLAARLGASEEDVREASAAPAPHAAPPAASEPRTTDLRLLGPDEGEAPPAGGHPEAAGDDEAEEGP